MVFERQRKKTGKQLKMEKVSLLALGRLFRAILKEFKKPLVIEQIELVKSSFSS